ncbi:MAG: hypothetical protein HQL67_07690 [Magnetococcales bacterium]|nr:hypothetical protein [Magnetococcales bacterium]
MEWRMVWTTFFLMMALTTTVSYLSLNNGLDNNGYELIIAVSMNLIATTLKLGARKTTGAMTMAASLVADFHLVPALWALYYFNNPTVATSLAWGAVIANIVSIILLIVDAILRQMEIDAMS